MRHLKKYKIFENSDVCTSCSGSGEVDREINYLGDLGRYECEDCSGTGKSSYQKISHSLQKFQQESESLLKNMFESNEIRFGAISSNIVRYSKDFGDIEKIEIKAQIYSTSEMNREFFEKLSEEFLEYSLLFDVYDHLYLYVTKPF
jgi:hypothetical protein